MTLKGPGDLQQQQSKQPRQSPCYGLISQVYVLCLNKIRRRRKTRMLSLSTSWPVGSFTQNSVSCCFGPSTDISHGLLHTLSWTCLVQNLTCLTHTTRSYAPFSACVPEFTHTSLSLAESNRDRKSICSTAPHPELYPCKSYNLGVRTIRALGASTKLLGFNIAISDNNW